VKRALITGITGQDGSYLAEFLLERGYEVHGIKRRASLFNTQRVDHIYEDPHVPHQRFVLHHGDLSDGSNLTRILQQVQPDEVYNLGAQSHVAVSFEAPEYTADVDALRDWGHARDYVRMQWLMLQQDRPEDYVIATGTQHSVRDFVRWAAEDLGVKLRFEGQGEHERALVEHVDRSAEDRAPALEPGDCIVEVDPRYFRPAEVETLLGDPSKARRQLGWQPTVSARQMCAEMVAEDLKLARRAALLHAHGHRAPLASEQRESPP
jgi:GDP-D-mannose dehydratase